MNAKKEHYHHLIGKEKSQVKREIGQEFNFYPASEWNYHIGKDLIGRNIYLIIHFKEEKVHKIEIKKCYGKFSH